MMRRRDFLGASAAVACTGWAGKAATAAPVRGLWRDAEGNPAAIGRFPEFGQSDFLFDYAARRVGPLAAGSGVRRAVASTLDGSGAPAGEIALDAVGLRIDGRILSPVPIRRMPFEASAEGATLSAELALPPDQPRGLAVMIYGSGPAPKEAFDLWSFWFLAAGYAVATYDKRGSGRSTGDWRLAGLETLAADARTVIASGRSKLGVAGRVIAWGASQAGWIMPQLAASGVVDALIMHAGSAMTPGEQIVAALAAELAAYGFPAEEIARAKAYYALDTDVSRGRRPWSDIDAAYRAAASAEWLLAPPAAADAPERTMIRLMADFDPAPWWARSAAPLLALFGGKDLVVPAAANRALLARMMPASVDFRPVTLPLANHLMFEAETGVRAEYGSRARLDAGYFPGIDEWLGAHA